MTKASEPAKNTKPGGADPEAAAGLQQPRCLVRKKPEQRVLLFARGIANEGGEVAVTICARNAARQQGTGGGPMMALPRLAA